jgi:hypothetical protein
MKKWICILALSTYLIGNSPAIVLADEVTDWNRIMLDALRTGGVGGVIATRHAAIVQSAVYDAVNGIECRYQPVHVEPAAAPGASRRAAAVQAAYATLLKLFPSQQTDLNAKRAASLAAISSEEAVGNSQSIARGIEWGQQVADAIWTWRGTDGFTPAPPPFFGVAAPGQWRSTPPAFLPMAGVQFAFMPTWIINSPFQFPLSGPPPMNSPQYAADFNEVKMIGSASSPTRTADQTLAARFWASSSSPNLFWNRLAVSLGANRHTTLSENARLLAMLNVAMADAGITVWTAKYNYNFWRPITAVTLADTDANAATIPDPGWTPLIVTPPYPDYPSGLLGVSGAAVTVLANYFGANTPVVVETDSTNPALIGVTRSFPSFPSALDELVAARIYSGIHFRTADADARQLGTSIANYIIGHAFQPLNGKHNGQMEK